MKQLERRDFLKGLTAVGGFGLCSGCAGLWASGDAYSVSVLGDTHYDTAPDTHYHKAFLDLYRGTKKHPARFKEFIRNAKNWAGPSKKILAASGRCVTSDTAFALQLGDLVQGDCGDFAVHKQMLRDTVAFMKSVYPEGFRFITTCGNHDIRHGIDGHDNDAVTPYREFIREYAGVEETTYGFRQGPDLYLILDFNHGVKHMPIVKRILAENPDVRYTFVVTHGGVIPFNCWGRWFYLGWRGQDDARREMRALFARRNAIVLSGHTHHLELKEVKLPEGTITEMTMNTVQARGDGTENPAVPENVREGVENFAASTWWLDAEPGRRELAAEYKPYMTRFYHADAVGHAKLRVSDEGVWFDYYGRDALTPTKTFALRTPQT